MSLPPLQINRLIEEILEDTKLPLDTRTGSTLFLSDLIAHTKKSQENDKEPQPSLSPLAVETCSKLDGVWSVQLFFRTWPYYARRANRTGNDPFKDSDIVISETLPLPELPKEIKALLQVYTTQLWGMSLIYIEAILEHYFLGTIQRLRLNKSKLPRQASSMFNYLKKEFQYKYDSPLLIPEEKESQLKELTERRHLWVHLNGIVDEAYLRKTENWWKSRPKGWFEKKPVLNKELTLSENYIKGSIHFAENLVHFIEEQICKCVREARD